MKKISFISREISQSAKKITTSVFEATDVATPTFFIVLPYKTIAKPKSSAEDDGGEDLEKAGDFAAELLPDLSHFNQQDEEEQIEEGKSFLFRFGQILSVLGKQEDHVSSFD